MFKLIVRLVHRYLGIVFGFFIFALCISGGLITLFDYLRSDSYPFFTETMRFAVTVHRWFLLPDRLLVGYPTGCISILLVILVITGIARCWPKRSKYTSRMFLFRFKRGYMLYNTHRIAGVYVSLWLSVLAITGASWSFPTASVYVSKILNIEHVPSSVRFQQMPQEDGTVRRVDLDEIMTPHEKMMIWIGMVHTGKWGAGLGEILNVLSVIQGCLLVVTGYMIYFKQRAGK